MYTALAALVAIFLGVLFSAGKRANTRVNRASMLRFSKRTCCHARACLYFYGYHWTRMWRHFKVLPGWMDRRRRGMGGSMSLADTSENQAGRERT